VYALYVTVKFGEYLFLQEYYRMLFVHIKLQIQKFVVLFVLFGFNDINLSSSIEV